MISWAYTWHRPEGRLALDDMCERMADLALQMVGVRSTVTADSRPVAELAHSAFSKRPPSCRAPWFPRG